MPERVVIIGGSGHVGTYLVPRLVEAGYEVVNVARGERTPYHPHAAWRHVETIVADREAEDAAGTFGARISDLKPDVVIDMICFSLASAEQLVTALMGQIRHFVHIGTIWVHGPSVAVPTTEAAPRRPLGAYGVQKAAIEAYLMAAAQRDGFPATVAHPGHIVGPGWTPLNPAGHFNNAAFDTIAAGQPLALPNFGQETVHHVHADDVALVVMATLANRSTSVGEAFHAVSPAALSLRGYAEAMYRWFGHAPNLTFLPWEEWVATQTETDATATWEHIYRSPSCSMAKAERLLGCVPRHTSLAAVEEAVTWLIANGKVKAG